MKPHPHISVVAPVFNESENLSEFHERICTALGKITSAFEIIYINDGSTDNSVDVIRAFAKEDAKIKYLSFSRNFGHQVAASAGLDHAMGECVIIIDTDLQDPPELIESMYEKYKEGFKVVYAKRRQRAGETGFKRWSAALFYRTLRAITQTDIPIDTGDYRLMDKAVADVLRSMPEKSKFLRGQVAWAGFSQTFIEFDRPPRKHGETGYPIRRMMRFAMDGVTGFSDFPLRVAMFMGFLFSFVAFGIIIYALYSQFTGGTITGWTSIIISSMFIGGIQLLCIGIIGEYISRIYSEVKHRPLYVVEESNFDQQ